MCVCMCLLVIAENQWGGFSYGIAMRELEKFSEFWVVT